MLHVETGKYGQSTENADRWYVKYETLLLSGRENTDTLVV
jgi:hypothetical protein